MTAINFGKPVLGVTVPGAASCHELSSVHCERMDAFISQISLLKGTIDSELSSFRRFFITPDVSDTGTNLDSFHVVTPVEVIKLINPHESLLTHFDMYVTLRICLIHLPSMK